MRGFLLTAKKADLWNSIAKSNQIKMALACASVGVMAGVFISSFKLNLGLSGHKAFFWMTPVILARLMSKSKVGTTVGGFAAAITTYSLGSNLAGGFLGIGFIAVAGAFLDTVINLFENRRWPMLLALAVISLAGLFANIICLSKRMLLPQGISPHYFFGNSGVFFKLLSYALFGFAAGFTATLLFWIVKIKQRKSKND